MCSSARQSKDCDDRRGAGFALPALLSFALVAKQVARLAGQLAADRLQRRKADRLGLAGLEDRQVGEGQPHAVGKLGQGHPPFVEQVVELHGDSGLGFGGHYTVPSSSSRISVPLRNTRARMNSVTANPSGASESCWPPLALIPQVWPLAYLP